jgi:hypothetical protein
MSVWPDYKAPAGTAIIDLSNGTTRGISPYPGETYSGEVRFSKDGSKFSVVLPNGSVEIRKSDFSAAPKVSCLLDGA